MARRRLGPAAAGRPGHSRHASGAGKLAAWAARIQEIAGESRQSSGARAVVDDKTGS